MVEVMVTIVIMTIGMLGVAGLQLAGMRSNHSAYLRTQATIAAYDLIDRMRVDPNAFNGEHFKGGSDSGSAAFDDWVAGLTRMSLRPPAGKSVGEVNCGPDEANACHAGNCEVIVRWDDSRGENADLVQKGRKPGETVFRVCTRLAQTVPT